MRSAARARRARSTAWTPVRRGAALRLGLVLLVLAGPHAAAAQPASAADPARPITRTEVTRAIEQVKDDPNLATTRTIRMLKWTSTPPSEPSRWTAWILGFFRWIGQSARAVVWVAGFLAALLLALWLVRALTERQASTVEQAFVAPTHVRDMDIRPESLPADIGAAARRLWDRGEHRAALAVLYRGLLSRLAHVHRVPIRDSSTEGDCLALAAGRLAPDRQAFAVRLVQAWQLGVYGAQPVSTDAVHAICAGFSAALDRAGSQESAPAAAPALTGGAA